MANLVPTRIVDRNGKETTVHKRQQKASIRNLFGLARPPRLYERPETVGVTVYKEELILNPERTDPYDYMHDPEKSEAKYEGDIQKVLDCYPLESVIEMAESSRDRKYLYHTMSSVGMIDFVGMNFSVEFDNDNLAQYIEYRQANDLEDSIGEWRTLAIPFAESMTRITFNEKSGAKPSDEDVMAVVSALTDTSLDGVENNGRYEKVRGVIDSLYGESIVNAYTVENLYRGVGLYDEISSEWFQQKP